jgi:integrase
MKTNQIKHYYQVYLEEAEYARGLRKMTLKNSQEIINNFTNLMPEITLLEELSPNIIVEFFKRVTRRAQSEGKTIKKSTIYSYYSRLNPFFGWLEDQRYIPKGSMYNKVPKPEKPTYTDIKALTDSEVEILVATISLESIKNTFLGIRDRAIIYTLLYTGLRRGELLSLRIGDIDLENNTLFVQHQTSKSKKGRRIPLNPLLVISLKQYFKLLLTRKRTTGHLFISRRDTPLTNSGIKSWVEKYVQLSGIKFSLHKLRHTFACSLAKQNADIVSIKCALGHSSILMTDRYLRSIGSENSRVYIDKLSF